MTHSFLARLGGLQRAREKGVCPAPQTGPAKAGHHDEPTRERGKNCAGVARTARVVWGWVEPHELAICLRPHRSDGSGTNFAGWSSQRHYTHSRNEQEAVHVQSNT
jgi:hypothetical protein